MRAIYDNRRLWITFLRRFWGWILGGFGEPTGPGGGVRGVFSADGVLLVRWASANLVLFSTFFTFLVRFLPVFRPYFALFPSMPCAYLYVHNFRRTRVSHIWRGNLASDKETALDGRGERDCGFRISDCGLRIERQNQRPGAVTFSREPKASGRRWGSAGKISHLTKKQRWTASA